MKNKLLLLCCVFFLVACQPSAADIEKAIAQTQAAMPTDMPTATPEPTKKIVNTARPWPTNTRIPTMTKVPITSTPTHSVQDILNDVATLIMAYDDGVESVTTIRPGSESLEVELRTQWASRDRQPDVSFQVIKTLADVFGDIKESSALKVVDGSPEHFSILLTTYSTDGDYKYSSLTYYEDLVKLHNKQITYDEWLVASKAGFVN